MHHLKKPAPQVCLLSQGLKRVLCLRVSCILNNYDYMVHHFQFIENIQIKDFNELKKPIIS